MKKRKKRNKFNINKKLKDFIKDDEGFISKKTILKIGLGTISALGVLSSLTNVSAQAHASHTSHNNSPYVVNEPVPGTNCQRFVAAHVSHVSHASHSNY